MRSLAKSFGVKWSRKSVIIWWSYEVRGWHNTQV